MLEQFIKQKPDDPFPKYGLALELKNQGKLEPAAQQFATIVSLHENYVPTYLMYGNLLRDLGKLADAAEIYKKGQGHAQKQGNNQALNELTEALALVSQTE